MASATHILDTSAILAHYFDEPGAAEVDALWRQKGNTPAICVLTIPELKTRLQVEIADPAEVERVLDLYVNHLTVCLPVNRTTAEEAMKLRVSAAARLPLVDACIAGCARQHRCILVHRDPHLDGLPDDTIRQLRLPDKAC